MILVSACLAGYPCRYDGRDNRRSDIVAMVQAGEALPVCPEQLGGLSTPRSPCELYGEKRVFSSDGEDKTEAFLKGARAALELCRLYHIDQAILKARSPSCGYGLVYDGTFTATLREGMGLCAGLLAQNGIEVSSRE